MKTTFTMKDIEYIINNLENKGLTEEEFNNIIFKLEKEKERIKKRTTERVYTDKNRKMNNIYCSINRYAKITDKTQKQENRLQEYIKLHNELSKTRKVVVVGNEVLYVEK